MHLPSTKFYLRGMAMKLEEVYASIIEKYPAYINQKQMCEICGFSQKTARSYETKGVIHSTVVYDPGNPLLHERRISLMQVLAFLYRKECREEPDSDFIVAMKKYYAKRFSGYSDLLIVSDVEKMTGFRSTAITNWINKHGLVGFKRGKRFLIPKASLIEFLTSPYYRLIKNKSKLQRKCIIEYERAFDGGEHNG